MIPNVYFGWCQRTAKCKWCEKPIEAATAEVNVFYWNKGSDSHSFNTKRHYHPQCWLEQGLDYLRRNPYVAYQRKKSLLIDEQRKVRYQLLRRKAQLEQQKRKLKPGGNHAILVAKLDQKIAELLVTMLEQFGSAPKGWLDGH